MKSSSARSKLLKVIIRLILFLIHMYLWGTDAVFLWRYPHISNGTNFELEGWNQDLAEANCSTSSSGWSYFEFTSICEEVTLYFSGDIPIFLVFPRGLLMMKRCFLTCQEWALLSISSLTFRLDFQTIEMVFLSWIDWVFRIGNSLQGKVWLNVFRVETSQHSICNFYTDLWMIRFVFLIRYNLISVWNIFAAKGLTQRV